MTDNEFDDILKERLQQHDSPVPADMWQRIVNEKKKRRFVFMWRRYFALIMLLLTPALVIYFSQHRSAISTSNSSSLNSNHPIDTLTHQHSPVKQAASSGGSAFLDAGKDNLASGTRGIGISKKINSSDEGVNYHADLSQNNHASTGLQEDDSNENTNTQRNMDSLNSATVQQKPTNKNNDDVDSIANSVDQEEDGDKLSIRVFASPDFPFNDIASGNKGYESLLKDAIHMKLSYTIGASISLKVSKRISLSTGIQYSRVNETISFEDSIDDKQTGRNRLNFINVPFTLSYHTKWSASFKTSVNAGILLNISSHYKGMLPDQFGERIDISHGVYKNGTGVSVYAGINFSKAISDKFDVYAEPYLRYQLKSITDNLQPFTRRIHTPGVMLGVQYRLFNVEKE